MIAPPRSSHEPGLARLRRCSTAGSTTWSGGCSPAAASSPPRRSRWTAAGPRARRVAGADDALGEPLADYARDAIERGELRARHRSRAARVRARRARHRRELRLAAARWTGARFPPPLPRSAPHHPPPPPRCDGSPTSSSTAPEGRAVRALPAPAADDGRPMADLLELLDGVDAGDAVPAIVAAFRGWRVGSACRWPRHSWPPERGRTGTRTSCPATCGAIRRPRSVAGRRARRLPAHAGRPAGDRSRAVRRPRIR